MEFLLELLLELFGAVLEAVFENATVPKKLKIILFVLLFGGILAFVILGIIHVPELLLALFLGFIMLGLFGLFIYFVAKRCRYGILRPARKEELPDVLQLYRSVIGTPGCHWSINYPNEATLHDDFRNGCLFVLKKGKKLIGSGSIAPKNELDDLSCWWYKDNTREIARIVIAPSYQGKGYGKNLVNTLCRKCGRHCKAVHILVSDQNNHAKNLYRESGFFPRGPVERYGHHYIAFERNTGNKVNP